MTWIENKRVVVTGATSGLGREMATRLAALGAHVVLACRDRGRSEAVAGEINGAGGTGRATVMTVDTSDPRSIVAFGRSYRDAYDSLDVLVNNAGVVVPERRANLDAVELTFATNVLGYHLVTTELLDSLRAGAPSRVVNVASTFAFAVDMDDLQFERRPYDGLTAYAQSKALDRMLTWAFARRLPRDLVTANAMAPGLVLATGLYRDLSAETRQDLARYDSRSVSEGADTAVWLASSPDLDGVTGRFFERGTEKPCEFRSEEAEDRLWKACEELAGQPAEP